MVGKPSGGFGTSSSSLTSLVPRQVMLDSRSVVAAAGGDKLAEKKSKKRRKAEREETGSSPAARAALLRAVAAFLESSGFTRTLAVLRSEALLEIDDGSKTPVLDLEEIICNYLELSEDPVIGSITGYEEQGSRRVRAKITDVQDKPAMKEEDGIQDHFEEPIFKKKKKKVKGDDDNVNTGSCLLDESNVSSKDKKKKKNKLTSDSFCEVANEDGLKTSQEEKGKPQGSENATTENSMGEDNSKSKDKKKRKHNLVAESSSGHTVEVQNGSKVDGGKKGKSATENIEKDAKGSNPNIESSSCSPYTVNIDKKAKKRKRSTSEETELHVDNGAAVQEAKQDLKEGKNKEETEKLDDSLLNSELHTSRKKKKSEKSENDSEKIANIPMNKQSQVEKDTNGSADNGNVGKNENQGNGSLKSKKVELKHSAEPKTVNAFQRVKIDEVKFADERLQDNSYWAKDGADTGYGAKAQDVLGQVRGRDFRHEKTKKKRGSYRGGQIDFHSHSVKFTYSDDED
ncbi:hypothetical protein Taro_004637 [Colocasia esculenta]|uniref:Srp40 C-terminal domain-containing protein n=1 Tax=Colocasia esculenta TaxID=4460 RepID=A0A843TQ44_COLES|nr:hypothetical protein [Colocasia esculenta]